jgi:hypothetical protein
VCTDSQDVLLLSNTTASCYCNCYTVGSTSLGNYEHTSNVHGTLQ